MKKPLLLVLSVFLFIGLTGCGRYVSKEDLGTLSLKMEKNQALASLREKGYLRGSIYNKYNQVIEVYEIKVDHGKDGAQIGAEIACTLITFGLTAPLLFSHGEIGVYWLYFVDDKLVQWGKAGDWDNAQKQIYEIRYR